jgi:signal transduction histidine kinase
VKLHDFVEQNRARILETWERKLREVADAAEGPDRPRMEAALDDVIHALERATAASPRVTVPPVRIEQAALPVEAVVYDYGALCDAIMQMAADEAREFSAKDYQLLNLAIDEAIAHAISQFFRSAREGYERLAAERLGILAHELRNALSSAKFAFNAIEQGRVGTRGKTADVLKRSHDRMGTLIEHTFLTTAMRAGGEALARRAVDVRALARDVAAAAVTARGVCIRVEDGDPANVVGDATLLTSAIGNLVQNAIKFTKDGSCILVRTGALDGHVTLEVEDECGGLPSGATEELFRPYVQRGNDRSGAGLGLTLARDVAFAHGGDLRARNLPGKGCIFALSLLAAGRGVAAE